MLAWCWEICTCLNSHSWLIKRRVSNTVENAPKKAYNGFNDSHKTRNSLVLIWLSWREWTWLTYDQIKMWVLVSTENAPVQFNRNLIHKFLNLFARMLMYTLLWNALTWLSEVACWCRMLMLTIYELYLHRCKCWVQLSFLDAILLQVLCLLALNFMCVKWDHLCVKTRHK